MRLADTVLSTDVTEATRLGTTCVSLYVCICMYVCMYVYVDARRLMRVATQMAATDPRTGTIDMDMISTGRTQIDR